MKHLMFMLAVITAHATFAQTTLQVQDSGNITRERWRDSTFRMDKSQVPTGFLWDYSTFGFESAKYDGQNNDDDTIKTDGRIFELHNILWESKVNTNAVINPTDSLFQKAFFDNRNSNVVPLTFVYQKYNRIRQTALDQNLFRIAADSVGILDVAGRTQSPYDTYEAFTFAPFKTKITSFYTIPFTLPAELFYMQGISSVEIDFGDGAGFRNLAKGSTINIYYSSNGLKYLTARIITTAGTRIAKAMIDYKRPATFSKPAYSLKFLVSPVYTSDDQYLGSKQVTTFATTTISPCDGNSYADQLLCSENPAANVEVENGCDKVFDKPIIIVEGFDPTGSLDIKELRNRFNTNNLIPTMLSNGYDFVYVDFTKNTTYIENNAKVLEAVINWVNTTKTGTAKSTIIGFSMGGLISRWCLRDMENRGLAHQVENYFSYDAPHQGANIPLGMQYVFKELVRDLPYLKWDERVRKLDDAFKSPAARQMLVTYGSYTNGAFNWTPNLNTLNSLRAAFAPRLQTLGYPQQTRNFGVSFGRGNNTVNTKDAGNGRQFTPANPFAPLTEIFSAALVFSLVNAESSANAVPENNTTARIATYRFFGVTFRKIFGRPIIRYQLRVRKFDYLGQFSYDDAPGSFEQTQQDFVVNWVKGLAPRPTTNSHDGHNFVAIASALDLQNQNYSAANSWQSGNMFFNIDNAIINRGVVNGNTLNNPALSPFRAVITGTSECGVTSGGCSAFDYTNENGDNIPATSSQWNHYHNGLITAQSAQFIERNILNANPVNCAGNNGLCGVTPTISGPPVVCTTGQFELLNLPNGVTIDWQIQNNLLKITNGNGTSKIDVSSVASGSETIRVTLTNTCGASLILTKIITVGTPTVSPVARRVGVSCYYDATVSFSGPGTTVEFSRNNSSWTTGTQSGGTVYGGYDFLGPANQLVYTRTRNACGTGPVTSKTIYIPAPPSGCIYGNKRIAAEIVEANISEINEISVYPNPAAKKLIVQVPATFNSAWISIYSNEGKLVYKERVNSTRNVLNIASFKAGLYSVNINVDGQIKVVKIIKE